MNNRALHRFSIFTAAVTFLLLGAGGLVTSHGVGMAVPDWPNTFGYNMFFFPFSQWVGGVFYEHSHRLLASGVGLLTTVLALWLYGWKARRFLRVTGFVLVILGVAAVCVGSRRWQDAAVLAVSGLASLIASRVWPRCEPAKPWLRKLGLTAFAAVVLQGVLGGLRVVLFKDQIGIFHATLAQLFFVLICALALLTSRWWRERFDSTSHNSQPAERGTGLGGISDKGGSSKLVWFAAFATVLILGQLILGATMRHQHAGLAVPDFPLAYGKIWPAMDPQSVAHYNQQRIEVVDLNPISALGIMLHMAHRCVALCILLVVCGCAWFGLRELGPRHVAARLGLAWLGLILLQAALGAATIWSNKAADIATAHVLVGALSLAIGTMLSMILVKDKAGMKSAVCSVRSSNEPASAFAARPSTAMGIE